MRLEHSTHVPPGRCPRRPPHFDTASTPVKLTAGATLHLRSRRASIAHPPPKSAEDPQPGRCPAGPSTGSWRDVEQFLATELDLPSPRVQKLASRNPFLVRASIDDDLAPNIRAIRSLGARPATVRRMAERSPQLLTAPLPPWIEFLTSYGVEPHGVLDILGCRPEVVARGSIFNAGHVLLFLKDLGLTDRVILNLVLPRWPDLLARDVKSQMAPVVDLLLDLLGDARAVKEVVNRSPWLLRFDAAQRLDPTLAYLRRLGLRDAEVKQVARRCSSVLLADVELCLKPKVAFLASLGLDGKEVNSVVVACPQVREHQSRFSKFRIIKDA